MALALDGQRSWEVTLVAAATEGTWQLTIVLCVMALCSGGLHTWNTREGGQSGRQEWYGEEYTCVTRYVHVLLRHNALLAQEIQFMC